MDTCLMMYKVTFVSLEYQATVFPNCKKNVEPQVNLGPRILTSVLDTLTSGRQCDITFFLHFILV